MKEIIGIIITGIFAVLVAYMNRRNNHRKKERDLLPHQEHEPENEESEPEREQTYQIEINEDVVIFILDDNADDMELVVRVVKSMKENFRTFTDKNDYLYNIPDTANVHIIDHYLTLGYGWEILLELKKRNKSNFVILYSGTKDKKTVEEYRPYKIDRVVYKDDADSEKLLKDVIREGLKSIRGQS